MKDLVAAFDKEDFALIKAKAHSIKGSSGYIGAGIIYYCCYQIQDLFVQEKKKEMLAYYPTLVESIIEFRIHSRKLIAEFKSKFTMVTHLEEQFNVSELADDVKTCPVSN